MGVPPPLPSHESWDGARHSVGDLGPVAPVNRSRCHDGGANRRPPAQSFPDVGAGEHHGEVLLLAGIAHAWDWTKLRVTELGFGFACVSLPVVGSPAARHAGAERGNGHRSRAPVIKQEGRGWCKDGEKGSLMEALGRPPKSSGGDSPPFVNGLKRRLQPPPRRSRDERVRTGSDLGAWP